MIEDSGLGPLVLDPGQEILPRCHQRLCRRGTTAAHTITASASTSVALAQLRSATG
jgi:hypothetical protein